MAINGMFISRIGAAGAAALVAVAIVGSVIIGRSAVAQTWLPVARQCADTIITDYQRRHGMCASCGFLWPQWSACTVAAVYGRQISEEKIVSCVDWTKHATARFDDNYNRTAVVMDCVRR